MPAALATRYHQPETLDDALASLARAPHRLLAGGTDVFPSLQNRPLTGAILDLTRIGSLRRIWQDDTAWNIGAGITWSDLLKADLPSAFDALKQAACEVGSIQIQNRGTLAGNLCNASPAADGVPALLVLDAMVELASATGTRQLPLQDFILGNRKTALRPDEILTAIRVPKPSTQGVSRFEKLGARRYLVISIAMLAIRLEVRDGVVGNAALAVGACSAVAQRLPRLEQALIGKPIAALFQPGNLIMPSALASLQPIDDVRASAAYRTEAVAELIRRAISAISQSLA
jgi:CO/xanthine dehydrogenase FAD-binding subunit